MVEWEDIRDEYERVLLRVLRDDEVNGTLIFNAENIRTEDEFRQQADMYGFGIDSALATLPVERRWLEKRVFALFEVLYRGFEVAHGREPSQEETLKVMWAALFGVAALEGLYERVDLEQDDVGSIGLYLANDREVALVFFSGEFPTERH